MIKPTNYIGYHLGDVDDTYDDSSKEVKLEKAWEEAEHFVLNRGDEPMDYEAYTYEHIYDYETKTMTTNILDYGSNDDMYNLERDLHAKYDVGKNKKYFNLKRSGGAYKTIPESKEMELVNEIKRGKYTLPKEESIDDLYKELIEPDDRLQNRLDEDDKFMRSISDDMVAARHTKNTDPVCVRVDKDGKRKLFDGNTTLMAAKRGRRITKTLTTLKVNEVPYSVVESRGFTDNEFNEIGVLMNKKPDKRKRPCTARDVAQAIYNRHKNNGTPIKDKNNKKYINDCGYETSQVYPIVRAWKKMGFQTGTYINYKLPQYKQIIQGKKESLENKLTEVLTMSSARFRDEDYIEFLCENWNYGKKKAVKKSLWIILQHPNEVYENDWDDVVSQKRKEVKHFCGLTGVVFKGFKYMDTHK